MDFKVTILGSNAAIPANGRYPSSQVISLNNSLYLVDCGEGTQMRMNDYHISRGKINQIFISHLHGDHIFGLMGLLTSYSLNGRTNPLDVYGPQGLKEILDVQILHTQSHLSYPLTVHIVDTTIHKEIFKDNNVSVFTIPLKHRIPTCGYLFVEHQRPLNIIMEEFDKFNIPMSEIGKVKQGADGVSRNGDVVANKALTLPPYEQRSFAYCSDTAYFEDVLPIIQNCDLLYHETTFAMDKADRAEITGHSTTYEAAMIAKKASVKRLIIGHFSSRYIDVNPLLKEAQSIFHNTAIAESGFSFEIPLVRKKC